MNIIEIVITFILNTLFFITSAGFFIWIFRNTLFWVSLWQVKEYRVDRLIAHLGETSQGRMLFFSPFNLLKLAALGCYIVVALNEWLMLPYSVLIMSLYVYEALLFFYEIITRRVKRPRFTVKAALLVLGCLMIIYGLYTLSIIQQGLLWIILLDRLTPFVIAFFVFFLAVPTMLYQDYKIDLAIKKRQSLPHLRVIGITGSFGKSSTKEYTAQILAKKFSVVKTHGTNNTPIGLANTVISKLSNQTQIFVAEMGAYKRGEIAELCEIAQPHIGIITAVASQHLSLFGSVEKIAKTKFELIQSLPANGLAFFNGNNPGSLELSKKTKRKKVLYEMSKDEKKQKHTSDIVATNVKMEKNGVLFSIKLGKRLVHFKAPLIGAHMIENILPGIYLANMFGMSEKEIKDAVASLQPLPKTMVVHTSGKNVPLVDDTFNVNPDGVLAAMDYARIYKGKKMLVLEPMIELGSNAKKEHYRVGATLANSCDYIFLTKKNFYAQVAKGVSDKKGSCQVLVMKPKKIAEFINTTVTKSDIIVFEGKEAAVVLHKIV